MAALYCSEHGEAIYDAIKQNKEDLEEDELTKVVIGPIKVSGCRCNQCNILLEPGKPAVYVSHHNRQYPDDRGEYEYMDMHRTTDKKVYTIKPLPPNFVGRCLVSGHVGVAPDNHRRG